MNIPPKYEDVVAKLADATDTIEYMRKELVRAAEREAALREELAALRESYEAMRDRKNSIVYLQQRLTSAEQREAEAREELLDLSRKLDVFYSRSHGIKNLSAIEDANDKSKALQQRLTFAEQRADDMVYALARIQGRAEMFIDDGMHMPTPSIEAIRDIAAKAALKPAEGEGS